MVQHDNSRAMDVLRVGAARDGGQMLEGALLLADREGRGLERDRGARGPVPKPRVRRQPIDQLLADPATPEAVQRYLASTDELKVGAMSMLEVD